MKSVKRDNPRAERWKKFQKRPLPTSPHLPVGDMLGTTEAKIRKEIAIMKKCRHAHVVRLFEVIDDRLKDKIYMGTHTFPRRYRSLSPAHRSCRYFNAMLYTFAVTCGQDIASATAAIHRQQNLTLYYHCSHGISRWRRSQVEERETRANPHGGAN